MNPFLYKNLCLRYTDTFLLIYQLFLFITKKIYIYIYVFMYIQFANEIVSGSLTSLLLNEISGFNNKMLFIYYCEKKI